MEPGGLYPYGHHPQLLFSYQPGGPDDIRLKDYPPFTSRTLNPVRYYFIDFGVSVRFDSMESRKRLRGGIGHDFEPPEFFKGPWDPFKVDMRRFGQIINDMVGASFIFILRNRLLTSF